ncbi:glycosyltransferase [Hoyosella subflava]|uniref:Putative glycosyltransferase n=1 Tax=Hoyosella subflava (strain DSM 45089 / JCM 17490 / NBRC 109087 / DQS3-9A1) TaxID=443218 RepID=F6EKL2_HOYSD|nr:nucleotide disphospho-sugar-binding domain-containing protein [Hoyosella subflava]AEF40148.1 Putative glycosyltransferase [Hoyosella subflava DQS3-9A1]
MRIAVIAGPDPGHAFPAMALCRAFEKAGDHAVLITGRRWLEHAKNAGLEAVELAGLMLPTGVEDDDAGRRINERAAAMSTAMLPDLNRLMPDLVVSDVITVAGAFAAERLGIPWVELSPHPLYLPSRGLPPIGSGLEPGRGLTGRARDITLRAFVNRDLRRGRRQRAHARASIGLPAHDPGPLGRVLATLPSLELPRPDWPDNAYVVGPLIWEPATEELPLPAGDKPVVMVSPSTASQGGAAGVLEGVVAGLRRSETPEAVPDFRVAAAMLGDAPRDLPPWVSAGVGRQDVLLAQAEVLVCGAGHGIIARGLLAGRPLVLVPGGGDQRELANRVIRMGAGVAVWPGRDGVPDPQELAHAIKQVTSDPSFAKAARKAAHSVEGVTDVVSVCHRLLTGRAA